MLPFSLSQIPSDRFADHVFGNSSLGDARRSRRAIKVAHQMLINPGLAFCSMYASWGQSKAAYRLMSNGAVSPAALLGSHFDQVRGALPCDGRTVLLIEDTSEINYTFRAPIEGLSRVGPGNADHQGFLLHSLIAAVPEQVAADDAARRSVSILGLAHQEYYLRPKKPISKAAQKSYLARENRESELFERSTLALGTAPAGARFVRVADRGADIYLVLAHYQRAGHAFVIRAKNDRHLADQAGKRMTDALEDAAWCPETLNIELRARGGLPARTARMRVRMTPVQLAAPRFSKEARARLGLSLDPINCTVVHLLEDEESAVSPAPEPERMKGTKLGKRAQRSSRLEWKLLVSWPVETFAQACETARYYSTRWIIEEFHRVLKEGMGAERLQMQTGNALMNTVAMMCPIALRLVDLRERTRLVPQSPASVLGLASLELELLSGTANRPIKTVEDVAKAIGKLGGHLGRKSDGMPGTKTLFRGWRKLQYMVEAVMMYESQRNKGPSKYG